MLSLSQFPLCKLPIPSSPPPASMQMLPPPPSQFPAAPPHLPSTILWFLFRKG